jgi:hypothetical protein
MYEAELRNDRDDDPDQRETLAETRVTARFVRADQHWRRRSERG